jgi:hypothetical protein
MSKSRLTSGRIKKATGVELSTDRYEYLDLANAEPDLGVPTVEQSVLIGDTDGTRTWVDITTYAEEFKGYTGSQGDVGYTGSQGDTGYTGSQGDIGYTGSQGDAGFTGSQGDTGFTGSQGDTGFTGSQGDAGFTGSQGDVGFTGSQGEVGYVGSQGDIGYTGSQGIQGPPGTGGTDGASGEVGFTGSQGDTGFNGSQGDIGFTGSQGDIGYTGSQGDIGFTGSKGLDGQFGGASFYYIFESDVYVDTVPDGYLRLDASTTPEVTFIALADTDRFGTNIATFIQTIDDSTSDIKGYIKLTDESNPVNFAIFAVTGEHTTHDDHFHIPVSYVSGATSVPLDDTNVIISFIVNGDKGDIGYTGSQGDIGYTGSQGDIGFTGSQGEQGNIGFTGSQGDIGDLGFTGSAGFTGSQGDTGFVGSQGDTGFVGSQGDLGFTGSQGAGFAGSQGPAGLEPWKLITDDYTAVDKDRLIVKSSDNNLVITLPATPTAGNYLQITDGDSFSTYPVTINRNGNTIEGVSNNVILDLPASTFEFIYDGTTWQITSTTGPQGYTGSQGAGFVGSQGDIGFVGSQGDIGYTGSQGDTGFTGSQGLAGELGFTGSQGTGFTGSQGDTGFVGSQGDIGYTGSTSEATSVTISPVFRGALYSLTESQTVNNTTPEVTQFTTIEYDYSPGQLLTSTLSQFTIPAGVSKVRLSTSISDPTSVTGQLLARIEKNGSFVGSFSTNIDVESTGGDTPLAFTAVQPVEQGDVFKVRVFSDNSRTIDPSVHTWFAIEVIEGSMLDTTSVIRTTGFTGSQGAGFTGSIGFTGSAGQDGLIGRDGYTGSQGAGFTGSQGDTGFTGSQGNNGANGNRSVLLAQDGLLVVRTGVARWYAPASLTILGITYRLNTPADQIATIVVKKNDIATRTINMPAGQVKAVNTNTFTMEEDDYLTVDVTTTGSPGTATQGSNLNVVFLYQFLSL